MDKVNKKTEMDVASPSPPRHRQTAVTILLMKTLCTSKLLRLKEAVMMMDLTNPEM